MPIQINDRIILKNNLRGVVRYIGPVEGRSEEWVGIELEEPKGSNNGAIGGTRYFYCPEGHGLFVKYERLTRRMTSLGDSTTYHVFAEPGHPFYKDKDYRLEDGPATCQQEKKSSPLEAREHGASVLFGNEELAEENRKIKELLGLVLHRWNESLNTIQRSLQGLQGRIESINRACQARKTDDAERDLVMRLVSEMIESNRRRDREKVRELYGRFKKIMEKHKIKVD
ncbi:uncharacterized protein VICG_01578 [Vittaforma corneae ATCC 50505]|uniref:CAP-Gly domain-containing protein n=1 Tax=Vittaforma corneae (strain ATCC 50505) TaxID=993615 RepID=L2GKD0_VITCO|nr:uncharacterized protein VICG_01578 [Vittaforma corneae ATCC 50505]ELA41338.1 hypothetical protein VICG_01578 [Vittaforma corneae ATCC 50505]